MSFGRKYTGSDKSDRENFYNDYGKLQTIHVERYDLSGNYKSTDVYNNKYEK